VTHYLIHFHIFGGISPFEVFGVKDRLFEALSTYLEEGSMHEEISFSIVDMIKPSNE